MPSTMRASMYFSACKSSSSKSFATPVIAKPNASAVDTVQLPMYRFTLAISSSLIPSLSSLIACLAMGRLFSVIAVPAGRRCIISEEVAPVADWYLSQRGRDLGRVPPTATVSHPLPPESDGRRPRRSRLTDANVDEHGCGQQLRGDVLQAEAVR